MPEIEATTQIDYETYRHFFLFSLLRGRKSPWQIIALMVLAPIMTVVFLILTIANPGDVLNIIGFVLLLLATLVIAALMTLGPRLFYKMMEEQLMEPNTYRFSDEHLETFTAKTRDLPFVYSYDKIVKAYRTANAFYVDLGGSQVCIISEKDIQKGTPAELEDLLKDKLDNKLVYIKR